MIPDFYKKFHSDIGWINQSTILLVRHGSHCYGTNIASSDEDFKGVAIPPSQYLFGFIKRFEQAELKEPDAVIFDIRKFFNLASNANPNCLEVLFVEPEDIIHADKIGEELLANRDLFLSKKVKHTFIGYAISQLKRIQLHRKYFTNPPKAPPTRQEMGLPNETLIPQDQLLAVQAEIDKELTKYQFDFLEGLDEATKIEIRSAMTLMLAELKITAEDMWLSAARKIGMSDNFIEVMKLERSYTSKKKEWDQYQHWKTNRNKERAELEEKYSYDAKHALHLVRLARSCKDLLITGKLKVKRPDAQELISIRNGAWSYERLIEFASDAELELTDLYKNSPLPDAPDRSKLDALCISLIEKSYG